MVPPGSPIHDIADLKGEKFSAPADRSTSRFLLQALARRSGIDLKRQASIVYGAPPLLAQKAFDGEADATLNFWKFSPSSKLNKACDRPSPWRTC